MTTLLCLGRALSYLLGFFVFGLMCLLMAPIASLLLPYSYLDKRRAQAFARAIVRLGFSFIRFWCRITRVADMRLLDHTDGPKAQLMIANHLTMFDIVLLFGFIPRLQTLVNAKFARNPLMFLTIRASGYIPIKVGVPAEGVSAYARLEESLGYGDPVALFPEGTRSLDGQLGKLKKGAFRLAENRPVSFVFFTSTQAFLNREAFFPRSSMPVILEAHIFPARYNGDSWESSFKQQYEEFCRSPYVLPWNADRGAVFRENSH